jgi:hypothetical protein
MSLNSTSPISLFGRHFVGGGLLAKDSPSGTASAFWWNQLAMSTKLRDREGGARVMPRLLARPAERLHAHQNACNRA